MFTSPDPSLGWLGWVYLALLWAGPVLFLFRVVLPACQKWLLWHPVKARIPVPDRTYRIYDDPSPSPRYSEQAIDAWKYINDQ